MEPANDWQDAAISEEMDQQLAELSLSTDLYSIRAARMIGKLKSEAAVRWIVEETQGSESDADSTLSACCHGGWFGVERACVLVPAFAWLP